MKTIHDDRYKSLIRQLVAEREARDITQTALSVALSRPQSYVAKVENLERRLDIVELADWLRSLGADGKEFMHRFGWW
jgi:hypothetical protein